MTIGQELLTVFLFLVLLILLAKFVLFYNPKTST